MRPYALLATAVLFVCPFVQAIAQANAGPDQEVCGISTALQGNPPIPGDSGFWTLVSGNATFTDATDALTTVTDLDFGENVLLWTYINGFGATTDEVSIWAFDPLAPAASAGPDQTIVGPPFTAQLSGSACIEPCSCTWTLVAGTGVITDVTDPNAVITGLSVGTSILIWTCINGPCGATSDTISINALVWTGIENAPLATSNWLIFDSDLQQLTVTTTEPIDQILITDAQGRILHEMSAARTSRTWNMAQHAPGMYIVRAVIKGVVRSQRFLVIR